MLAINILKKCALHIRKSVKILIVMFIAGLIVSGLTLYIYKPTYSVTLNDEFVGYTQDKSDLQKRINDYLRQENGNVAFIQVDNMPEYHLCMLRKNIATNDDDIYNKVVSQGTKYYRYYALLNDGEEEYYFRSFENAQTIVDKLKEKNSANVDKITVIEKYNNETEPVVEKLKESSSSDGGMQIFAKSDDNQIETSDIDTCVSKLYEKKEAIPTAVTKANVSVASTQMRTGGGTGIPASGMNNSGNAVNIGISLSKPLLGTITSRFGRRSRDNHKGLDIAAPQGSSIYAAAGGTATTAAYGYNGGYGNYIIITHGNGLQTVYGHCSSLCISQGSTVSQGQLIAKVGQTGIATGPHLHFEVRINGVAQDPQNYIY